MRISDWSSDVCSSDLPTPAPMSFPLRSLTLSKRPELDRSNHHPRERPRATARHCRKVYCHRKRVGRTQLSALLDRYGLVLSLLHRKRKYRLSYSHSGDRQSVVWEKSV